MLSLNFRFLISSSFQQEDAVPSQFGAIAKLFNGSDHLNWKWKQWLALDIEMWIKTKLKNYSLNQKFLFIFIIPFGNDEQQKPNWSFFQKWICNSKCFSFLSPFSFSFSNQTRYWCSVLAIPLNFELICWLYFHQHWNNQHFMNLVVWPDVNV